MAPEATPHQVSPTVQISAKFPAATAEQLRRLGGGGSMSDALRTATMFGLMCLEDPDALASLDLAEQITQFRRWALQHAPGLTPSGAYRATAPDRLPEPGTIPTPAVISTPAGVIVTGAGETGALTVDAEHGAITLTGRRGDRWAVAMDLPDLASLAAAMAGALHALAAAPGVAHLPNGLLLHRHVSGMVTIRGGSQHLLVDSLTAFRLSAELSALLCAQIAPRVHERERLEDLMAAPAAEGVGR